MSAPRLGQMVHYQSFGTPRGEYDSQCRTAFITEVGPDTEEHRVGVAVLNPTGMYFDRNISQDESKAGGTWHWPCPAKDAPEVVTAPDGCTKYVEEDVHRHWFVAFCESCDRRVDLSTHVERAAWVGKHRLETGHTVRMYEEEF